MLSVLEKLKNSIFEMSIIPQTLNMNTLRTANAKESACMSLESLSNTLLSTFLKGNVYAYRFRDIAVRGTGSERVKFSVKSQKIFGF